MLRSKRKLVKVTGISFLIIFILLVVSTIGIGNYFINYALSPSGDGGNRQASEEVESETPVDQTLSIVDQNRQEAKKEVVEWKSLVTTEAVSITSNDDITLRGVKYYTEDFSHKWVIVVHGYRSNPDSVLAVGKEFYDLGFNVLSISMRAHANSDGEFIGMGWLDRLDLLKWIDLIIEEDKEAQIILHGTSMGGATVMMVSNEKLPTNVKAIIEDCGYTSVWDIFSSELDYRFGLPTFPIMNMVNIVAKFKVGYSFKEASALNEVKNSNIPILFIHGDQDDFVPVEMVYEVYEAHKGEKDLLIIEGAKHAEARFVNPETYYNKVFSFVDQYIE